MSDRRSDHDYRESYLQLTRGFERHLESRIQAVYEARLEQERRGEAGKLYVPLLQKELDTLEGVREYFWKLRATHG